MKIRYQRPKNTELRINTKRKQNDKGILANDTTNLVREGGGDKQ